jgi:pimeloyl-ACP methyl ester carboxylesterase
MINDRLVDAGDLPVAVRDFGGAARPLLLVHGGGGNLATVTALARALRPAHRVVTVDLRGHGRSGDGDLTWDAAVADLAAVAARLDLDRPAVVGHSFGGMLAARWGRTHPECPGVVSLDGTPPPNRPDQLPGLDPARARADLARLHESFDAAAAAAGRVLDSHQVDALLEAHRDLARQLGAAEKILVEGVRRNLAVRNGETVLRPPRSTVDQLRYLMAGFDPATEYAAVRCPALVVLPTRDLPQQEPFADLYAAYRSWTLDQLRWLRLPDASHAMVDERPAELAAVIGEFLAA